MRIIVNVYPNNLECSLDYLNLGQATDTALISQDTLECSWDYLDLGQVIARAWDIVGCPWVFLGLRDK